MGKRVTVSVEQGIAEVMLDRADKFNALDLDMFRELDATARELDAKRDIRAVVMHGAGENFCAGLDLSVMQLTGAAAAELLGAVEGSPANLAQRAAYAWRELEVPVVCALHGIAFGGGFQIALGADIRIAAPGVQLSIMEAKWGIIPDMAITTTLRDIVAPDLAKELALTARIFGAEEALRMGVVTRVEDDPLGAARTLAATIAERSPAAVRGIKKLFNDGLNLPEDAALALEAGLQAGILGTPNQAEAVRANLEKRKPEFVD